MGPKIKPVRLNNFRASGSILTGLFSVDAPRSRGDKMGTIFTMPPPKNLWRQKIVQNFSPFFTTFDFNREYLRNGSTLGEKNLSYFGPQTQQLFPLVNVHPNGLFFGRLYLGP